MVESDLDKPQRIGTILLPTGSLIVADACVAVNHLHKIPLSEVQSGPLGMNEGHYKSFFLGPEEAEFKRHNALAASIGRGEGPFTIQAEYRSGGIVSIIIDMRWPAKD